MSRTLISVAVILTALLLAWLYQHFRPSAAASTQAAPSYAVPTHLERWDFAHPNSQWLLAVFTSTTCSTCAAVIKAAKGLASEVLATQEVEYRRHRELHSRYGISAVPLAVLVDGAGTVVASLAGPATTEELAEVINSAMNK